MSGASLSPACERVRGRLERWLDGGLAPLEEALDRGHLEACAGCAQERQRWEELWASIRGVALQSQLAERAESARVERAVLEALGAGAELGTRRTGPRRMRRLLLPAALLLGLFALRASGLLSRELDAPAQLPDLGGLWSRLPTWSDVVDGLHVLTRHLS